MSSTEHFDVCIIGAGVIGLAVAYTLSVHPRFAGGTIVILERHRHAGEETSSRNSEVIHAGIYYPLDSLKARLCIEGKHRLYAYCRTHDIPHRQTGKLIIGGKDQEAALQRILEQAHANGADDLAFMTAEAVRQSEPAINAATALFSPSSGIIDSHAYMQSLLAGAETNGALFSPLTVVSAMRRHERGYLLDTRCQDTAYQFTCGRVVNCAGLHAQQVAGSMADFPAGEIPPQAWVKGSYFTLTGKSPFRHLIYPVPEPGLRGLGIHVTLDMAGQARFGPDSEPVDTLDYTVDPARETRFREAVARYFPGIAACRLQPGYSGIRPKLVVGQGVADFVIREYGSLGFEGLVQLFGIESPGLTASLAIADEVAALLAG